MKTLKIITAIALASLVSGCFSHSYYGHRHHHHGHGWKSGYGHHGYSGSYSGMRGGYGGYSVGGLGRGR